MIPTDTRIQSQEIKGGGLSSWWRHCILLVIITGFAVFPWVSSNVYRIAAPIPERIVNSAGKILPTVRGTPSIMLSDGTRLRHAIAFPHLRERKIVSVDRLPCHAEGCLESTRNLFEQALKRAK